MNEGLEHKHNYLLDVEAVFTPDGGMEHKGSIFLECVEGECWHIVRDNEIIELIEGLEEENAQLRERVEVYRDELAEVIMINIGMLDQYAKHFKQQCDVLKQIQRITEDPYWRTRMSANQMVDFLELLRKIVLDVLEKDKHGTE